MMRFSVLFCLGVIIQPALAAGQWNFTERMALGDVAVAGVFHHLDGAGRKHIAVSGDTIAVTWEDNRNSSPQVYVALKHRQQPQFSKALIISDGEEAYEPSIAALADGQFVLAWEQDEAVFMRLLQRGALSPAIKLSAATASHVSVAVSAQQMYATWREYQSHSWSLQVARISFENNKLRLVSNHAVETKTVKTPLLYPSIAASPAGLCVAWEDRRHGHTRLLYSNSSDGGVSFTAPEHLNEYLSNRNAYDKGNGVTRVSITAFSDEEVLAAWMDKRRGGVGYGIYAALGDEAGLSFGPNEKVHGKKGDTQPHYNPATAGNRQGDFVVAWDDFRYGDSDIWLSAYNEDDEWSDDIAPSSASGAGEQSHASVALDEHGGLHLLWLQRDDPLSPTRLWYSHGRPVKH